MGSLLARYHIPQQAQKFEGVLKKNTSKALSMTFSTMVYDPQTRV